MAMETPRARRHVSFAMTRPAIGLRLHPLKVWPEMLESGTLGPAGP